MKKTLAAALAILLAAPALAREVSGVKVPDTLAAAGKTLQLNGAGVRKKFIVKVYVGALYLEAPSADPAAIVAADEAKAVRMFFLRDVSQDQVMGAFKDGFENNSKERLAELLPKLERLRPAIPDFKEGAVLSVVYEPGTGTSVSAEKGGSVTVEGKDFADALFRNWLGNDPADGGLKEAMLGGK
jgi:hypothetical protein